MIIYVFLSFRGIRVTWHSPCMELDARHNGDVGEGQEHTICTVKPLVMQ